MLHKIILIAASLAVLTPVTVSVAPTVARADDFACKADGSKLALGAAGGLVGGAATTAGLRKMHVDKGVALAAGLAAGAFLTDRIACLLTEQERQQAAEATRQAVQQGVGSKIAWQSDARPNVSGTSSVLGEITDPDGTACRTVIDVVIVDGEETSVQKKLCRAPGTTGFKLAR
jgi:surface antigen